MPSFYRNLPSASGGTSRLVSKTGAYTAGYGDFILASGAAFTVTLPSAVGQLNKYITIKKTDASFTNIITIATTSAQTIDGASTRKLATLNESLTVTSDGANWVVSNHTILPGWTAYTPASAWSTNTTMTGFWRRVGDSIEVQVKASLSGAPNAGTTWTVGLPSGLTFDSARTVTSLTYGVDAIPGNGVANDNGSTSYKITPMLQSSTAVRALFQSNASGAMSFVSDTAPFSFGNTDFLTVWFSGPITNWEA